MFSELYLVVTEYYKRPATLFLIYLLLYNQHVKDVYFAIEI